MHLARFLVLKFGLYFMLFSDALLCTRSRRSDFEFLPVWFEELTRSVVGS